MDSPPSPPVVLPRIEPTKAWLLLDDETPESRLVSAVAEVLGLEKDGVQLLDSFVALGGTPESAATLRSRCMDLGIAVKTKDILRCLTLAELQTCITPAAPRPAINAPLPGPPESIMMTPLDIHNATRLSARDARSDRHSRQSSASSKKSGGSGSGTTVEDALADHALVRAVATTRPKAGPLEDKLVAFVALTCSDPAVSDARQDDDDLPLVPTAHMFLAGTHVAALLDVLREAPPSDGLPDAWVVLAEMPLTKCGDVDRRRLRTWAQNMNEATHRRVTSLDTTQTLRLPMTEMERTLQRLAARVLGLPREHVGVNCSFAQLGGDETAAMEFVARARHHSIYVDATEARDVPLAQLAERVAQRGGLAHKADETNDSFDLAPMQQLYLHTALGGDARRRRSAAADGSYRFNQSFLLRLRRHSLLEDVLAAVEAVVGHHAMLRSRFALSDGRWKQHIFADIPGSYALGSHSVSSDAEVAAAVERTQSAINIESGPVFAVDYFCTADRQQLLYVAAHHLAVDLPSWRVIIHDLDELLDCGSLSSQRSMPFRRWVELQATTDETSEDDSALSYSDCAYWGLDSPNTYHDACEASFSLAPETASALEGSCNDVFRTDPVDIYLATLLLSFAQTFLDRPVPVVWNQESGRDGDADVDISETVGWFTTLCPLAQKVEPTDDVVGVLRRLKDTRRATSSRGSRFFANKFASPAKTDRNPLELVFSHAGSLQRLEREGGVLERMAIPGAALASGTSDIGPAVGRVAVYEVNVVVDEGSARVKFLYGRGLQHQTQIATWISSYEHLLLDAVARLRYHARELTLADLPHLDVAYDGLARLNRRAAALAADLGLASGLADIDAVLPVTAAQQAVLVAQARDPSSNLVRAVHEFVSPRGAPVDASRLCDAWTRVAARHAALRSVFVPSATRTGLFDQLVLRRAPPDMLFIDAVPPADPVDELRALPPVRPDAHRPPHRLTVCRTPTKTLVQIEANAAVCDVRSLQILADDLWREYVGQPPYEGALLRYSAYLDFLKDARRGQDLAYWEDRLQGVQACMFGGEDIKREESRTRSNVRLEVDGVSADDLASAAASLGVSAAAVVQLAWALVLRAFVGAQRPVFGWRATGRDASVPGLPHAVGSFANVVPCAVSLNSDESLSHVLTAADTQLRSDLTHQHVTVAEIQHSRGPRRNLFNTCLSYEGGVQDSRNTDMDLKLVAHRHSSDADLSAHVYRCADQLVVDLAYRSLGDELAHNVAHSFGQAFRVVVSSPDCPVRDAPLFTDRDYAQVVSWSADAVDEQQTAVQSLVAARAAVAPDSPAVCSWDGEFTYSQLMAEASRLARHLVADVGLEVGAVVPVVLERNRWAPVALLAVLMAGAAFVPVDAEDLDVVQPVLAKLSSAIALAGPQSAPIVDAIFEDVVVVDDGLLELRCDNQPLPTVHPPDVACIIFPSVSADDAKGVEFSHAALATALAAQGPAARISAKSRVMQLSSFSVDVALSETLCTLVSGGCVCVPSARERLRGFAAAAERMRVSWTYLTPFLARKLDPAALPGLEVVCFRTRALDDDTLHAWSAGGSRKVLLAYGAPDVCPLGISFLDVAAAAVPRRLACVARPPVGRFWIVDPDDHRRLMPVGAVGELAIESPTLGRRFSSGGSNSSRSSSPVDSLDGRKKLFKTGHHVRYVEGGLIELVSDFQRDEKDSAVGLDDIEQHARRCLGYGVDLVVEVIGFGDDEKESSPLVLAFIELPGYTGSDTPSSSSASSLSSQPLGDDAREKMQVVKTLIREGLRDLVPPHLVPSIFVPVSHLPITPSLKVDRRRLHQQIQGLSKEELVALGGPEVEGDDQDVSVRPALTENESKLLPVWADTLGVPSSSVAVADGFVRAGGDQVLACQLVVACRQQGIDISIADVLGNVPLAQICRSMTVTDESDLPEHYDRQPSPPRQSAPQQSAPQQPAHTHQPSLPVAIPEVFITKVIAPKLGVERRAVKDVAEASAAQTRAVEAGMLRGRASVDYLVFSFTGAVDARALEEACQTLATIHPVLRTAFVPYNRKVYQAVVKTSAVEFRRVSCPSWRQASVTERLIRQDRAAPIAFSAPMTRFVLLDGGKSSVLVLRLSRAQYDDVSVALLVRDLKSLYGSGSGSDEIKNPPRRPSYCDFVRRAAEVCSTGGEQYWRALLEGSAMTRVVHHGRPHRLSTNSQTRRETVVVSSLQSLGLSFETVLKSAWSMVLAALSGSSDVVFAELVDARHESEESLVGPVANTVPVRVRFPDTALSPFALLQYVREQRDAGRPYDNVGFLDIVERCTLWPYWTRPSTVVQHQQRETVVSPREPKAFRLGPAACRLRLVESRAQDMYDLLVQTLPRENAKVEVSITFCADRVAPALASQALRMLCDTLTMLTSVNIMQPIIPAGYQYRAMQRVIPRAPVDPDPSQAPPRTPDSLPSYKTSPSEGGYAATAAASAAAAAASTTSRLSDDQAQAIRGAVTSAWTSVLHPHTLGVPEEYLATAAFYDLWGSLIPAAQLAAHLNRSLPPLRLPGLADASSVVSMEDIIDHPTMAGQLALISQKVAAASSSTDLLSVVSDGANQESGRTPSPGAQQKRSSGTLSRRIRRLASSVGRSNNNSSSNINITQPVEIDGGNSGGQASSSALSPPVLPAETPRLDPALLRSFMHGGTGGSREIPLPPASPFSSVDDGEADTVFAGVSETGSSAESTLTSTSGGSSIGSGASIGSGSSQYGVSWAGGMDEGDMTNTGDEGGDVLGPLRHMVDMAVAASSSSSGGAGGAGVSGGPEDIVSPLSMGSPRFWSRRGSGGGGMGPSPSPGASDAGDGGTGWPGPRRSWGSDLSRAAGRMSLVSPIVERRGEGGEEEGGK